METDAEIHRMVVETAIVTALIGERRGIRTLVAVAVEGLAEVVAADAVAMMAHVEVVDTTAPALEAGTDTEILPHLKSRGLPVAALKN